MWLPLNEIHSLVVPDVRAAPCWLPLAGHSSGTRRCPWLAIAEGSSSFPGCAMTVLLGTGAASHVLFVEQLRNLHASEYFECFGLK